MVESAQGNHVQDCGGRTSDRQDGRTNSAHRKSRSNYADYSHNSTYRRHTTTEEDELTSADADVQLDENAPVQGEKRTDLGHALIAHACAMQARAEPSLRSNCAALRHTN